MIHNPAEFLELRPVGISSTVELAKALAKVIRFRERDLGRLLRKPAVVRILDAIFIVRPNTEDLYSIWSEQYELKKWFLSLAEGTVVDVGAHIGKYVVHACKSKKVRRVIGIEPLIHNYIILKLNVALNSCENKVVLVRKAVDSQRRVINMYIPIYDSSLAFAATSLTKPEGRHVQINVGTEPLDEILLRLDVDIVDFLKVDIEKYVLKSLPGMKRTLKNTKWLMIELLGKDLLAHRLLKQHGFRLIDIHGRNYLYKRDV